MGVGAALAYGLHSLRPIVPSLPVITKITPFPVLGSVGIAFPTQHRAAWRSDLWRFSAGTACLLLAFAIALVLNWSGVRLSLQALHSLVTT